MVWARQDTKEPPLKVLWLDVGGDCRVYVYLNKSLSYTLRMSVLRTYNSAIRKVKGQGMLIKGLLRF